MMLFRLLFAQTIDYPKLADYIWGANVGQVWHASLSNTSFSDSKLIVYPNPAKNDFAISGLATDSVVSIYTILGNKLLEQKVSEDDALFDISNYSSGIYILKIISNGLTTERKIIKE